MSVAQLEVFPKKLILGNRLNLPARALFQALVKGSRISCPLDPEPMRIIEIGKTHTVIKTFMPPLVFAGHFEKQINSMVWMDVLENDMKNERYGFTYL